MIRQRIEKLGMRRRVGGAKVILGINQAPAKEMLPITIHERLGEKPTAVYTHPIDQAMARIVNRRDFHFATTKSSRLYRLVGFFVGYLCQAGPVKNALLARATRGSLADTREKRHELVVVVL